MRVSFCKISTCYSMQLPLISKYRHVQSLVALWFKGALSYLCSTHDWDSLILRSRLSADLLLAVVAATAVAITRLERLPRCLSNACVSKRLFHTLAENKKTQYVSAVLIRVYCVYSPIHNQRFAYCRYHCAFEVTHVTSTPLVGIYGLSTAPANKHRTCVTCRLITYILRYSVHTGSGAHSLRSRDSKERGDDPLSLDSSPTQWRTTQR